MKIDMRIKSSNAGVRVMLVFGNFTSVTSALVDCLQINGQNAHFGYSFLTFHSLDHERVQPFYQQL